ncbi:MAG: polysaccharide biosynthesis C-terminal domain-containing protein, partial [Candidatus Omnitrophota bacterium]
QTGIYSASFRFVSAFGFLAIGFTSAIFPLLAKKKIEDGSSAVLNAYKKTEKYLLVISLFVSIVFMTAGGGLIKFVYGENFTDSILPLMIMAFTPVFTFLNTGNSFLFFSLDREKTYLKLLIATLVFTVIINLILIPLWGYIGASVTTILPPLFFFILQVFAVRRIYGKKTYSFAVKPFFAAVAAFGAGYALRGHCHVVIDVFTIFCVYSAAILLSGVIGKDEINILKSFFAAEK